MTASVTMMDKFKLTTLTFPCLPSFYLGIYLLQSCWLFLLNIRSVTPLSHSGEPVFVRARAILFCKESDELANLQCSEFSVSTYPHAGDSAVCTHIMVKP